MKELFYIKFEKYFLSTYPFLNIKSKFEIIQKKEIYIKLPVILNPAAFNKVNKLISKHYRE
jgi:hypothetical protein